MQDTIDNRVEEVLDTCSNCGGVASMTLVNPVNNRTAHACSDVCESDLLWEQEVEEISLLQSEKSVGDL
jgi:hypothetical protein